MEKKRVVVLGGGISGLSAAYALKDACEVLLLEKEDASGGIMHAIEKNGFFFECGPRTFRTRGSPHLLALAEKLHLKEALISSSPKAKKRYVLFQKELHELPASPIAFFTSPLFHGLRKDILSEWRQPSHDHDETVYTFAERRFGKEAAHRIFDPFCLGIFGCDARRISMQSCFPKLKEWEKLYGSVTAGLFRSLFRKSQNSSPLKSTLFSFRKGTPMLVDALHQQLEGRVRVSEEVVSLQKQEKFIVQTTKGHYEADSVISALPPAPLGNLLHNLAPKTASVLLSIPMTALTVVHLGFQGSILSHSGFGYLVPMSEHEKVMGVVFDSEIFPQHNRGEQTRLTVMLHGHVENAPAIAIEALKRHLNISNVPDVILVEKHALPIMELGHADKLTAIQSALENEIPRIHLIGNYLGHPAVEQCIERALSIK